MRTIAGTVVGVSEDRRLFYLLSRAQRAVTRQADARLIAQHQITSVQAGALLYLAQNDGCPLGALGEGLGLNGSAVTGLAARLERLGLAVKRADPADGRSVRLALSAAGKKKALALVPLVRSFQAELGRDLSPDELDTVSRFLRGLIARYSESP